MNNLYIFSVITGEIYKIEESDLKNLFTYEIPITKKPKHTCKKCYGRGYEFIDNNKIYNMCSCLKNCILNGFDITKVKVFLIK